MKKTALPLEEIIMFKAGFIRQIPSDFGGRDNSY